MDGLPSTGKRSGCQPSAFSPRLSVGWTSIRKTTGVAQRPPFRAPAAAPAYERSESPFASFAIAAQDGGCVMLQARHLRCVLVALAATLASTAARAVDPLAVVRSFCQADGSGDRLSVVSWHNLAPLVDWRIEPAWDRLILVNGYEITTPRVVGRRVEVEIKYDVTGQVNPGEVVKKRRAETVTLSLEPDEISGWRVSGPPHPPHVFENAADPEALAELLEPESNYESNTAFVWLLLRDAGLDIPYTPSASIPESSHFEEVGTAAPGDLVVYYANGTPYHVGWMESEDSVLSASLNLGRRSAPFSAFAGPIHYWRPVKTGSRESGVESPGADTDVTPSPAPLRRP
jgi:hypothetical protein